MHEIMGALNEGIYVGRFRVWHDASVPSSSATTIVQFFRVACEL